MQRERSVAPDSALRRQLRSQLLLPGTVGFGNRSPRNLDCSCDQFSSTNLLIPVVKPEPGSGHFIDRVNKEEQARRRKRREGGKGARPTHLVSGAVPRSSRPFAMSGSSDKIPA